MNPDDYQKVKEIFNSVIEIEPAGRGAFLDEKCNGEGELRAEVERLLDSYDSEYLESPAIANVATTVSGDRFAAGDSVEHYTVVKKIGSGGMGDVYLAEDGKLGRQVAIKLLPDNFTEDVDRVRRFEQEARAASALNHPNILTIYEIGQTGPTRYIATEYIDGETLRSKLDQDNLPVNEALDIAVQCASALAAAHEAGVIHRDIKPENIMLRRDGLAKVLDFGLAKLVERKEIRVSHDALTERHLETAPGIIMGTVQYMSPEQTRGQATDARTDIWSLGVVCYEMLAGRSPFRGENTADLIAEIVKTHPAPLSQSISDVPERLDEIVAKTLEKNPDERYQTAKDLLIDLKRLRRKLDVENEMERSSATRSGSATNVIQTGSYDNTSTRQTVSSAEYLFSEIKGHKRVGVAALILVLAVLVASGYFAFSYWQSSANSTAARVSYANKIKLAAQALNSSDLALVKRILDETTPGWFETDIRGFEWGYLSRELAQRLAMQPMMIEHTQVDSVAFSPDSKTVATAGKERIIRLWDVATGQHKMALEGQPGWLTSVAFSPDGTKIASGAFDKTPKIWDVATGREILSLKADGGGPGSIAFSTFSPDGKLVAGGEVDRIRFWNAETLAEVTNFLDVRDVKGPFVFSGDGKMLAARWGGPGVKVFTIGTGKASSFTPVDGGGITGLDLSRDGSLLVTGDTTGIARLWDVKKGVVIKAFTGHQDWILDVAFSRDGKTFATGGKDATVRIWSVETLAEVDVLRGHTSEISALAYSPDGQRIASAGRDQDRVRIWNVPSSAARGVLRSAVKNVSPINFSPDGKTLAAVGDEKTVSLWDVETERPRLPLAGHDDQIFAMEFSPDSQDLATTGKDKKLKVWDLATGRAEISFDIGQTSGSIAFGPDGKRIATAHWFETRPVSVWDRSTGGLVCEAESHDKGAFTVSFSKDGSTIATSVGGDSVRIRDAKTCKEISAFGDPAGEHYGAYQPSGRLLSFQILNNGRSAKLFDVTAGKELASFSHEAELTAADITADESRLFTGDVNGLIKVWDMVTGQELLTLMNPGGKLDLGGVAVSDDGTVLAAIGHDGSIKLWRANRFK